MKIRVNIQISIKPEKPNPVSLKSSGTGFCVARWALGQPAAPRPRGRERLSVVWNSGPCNEAKGALLLPRGKSNSVLKYFVYQ